LICRELVSVSMMSAQPKRRDTMRSFALIAVLLLAGAGTAAACSGMKTAGGPDRVVAGDQKLPQTPILAPVDGKG